jgi:hypothetical protein
MFREIVIGFLGGNGDGKTTETPEDKYCRACKAAKKNIDCEQCEMRK